MNEKNKGALQGAFLKKILKDYDKDEKNTIVRHALSKTNAANLIYNSSAAAGTIAVFSTEVKTMAATNQKQSGRCWIFAGLNVLREIIAKKCNLPWLELSQNYISLYDKIEKCNYVLEILSDFADREPSDRELMHVLESPVNDGGQWDMFINLVRKYGVMPKSAFPETTQSNSTRFFDGYVNNIIRNFAYQAHNLFLEGNSDEIPALKEKMIEGIYHMFLNAFGVPPTKFDFQYRDEKNNYVLEKDLTPLSFAKKYLGDVIEEYQSCISSPTKDKPYLKNYTIALLGNVIEGKKINHLNLPIDRLKELIIAQLKDNEVVWFGSDVGFYRDEEGGVWDDNALDYESSFGFPAEFDKAGMLDFRASAMNHAMVVTGVDLDANGNPLKWKIENSWGEDNGLKGYYVMSDTWFTKFVYQAVILKKYLTEEELEATKKEPVLLPPWDPMGSLVD